VSQCGDGRIINTIASIPLIVAGYPMININLDQRAEYYEDIKRVSDWTACGGILLTMSCLCTRGRSRTVDKMFRRLHAQNPRVYPRALVRDLRGTCRDRFSAEPLKFRPRASSPSPCLLSNLSPVLLVNGATRCSTWPKKIRVVFLARHHPVSQGCCCFLAPLLNRPMSKCKPSTIL